jgi:hypothetical protein
LDLLRVNGEREIYIYYGVAIVERTTADAVILTFGCRALIHEEIATLLTLKVEVEVRGNSKLCNIFVALLNEC